MTDIKEKIKTLVVDDEPLAQELVCDYVRRIDCLELVGCCSNAVEALQAMSVQKVDLMLLDVQMPGLSGLSLAKTLEGHDAPKIVFTTAYGEYALEGFKLDAVDYLLKPFDYEEFSRAMSKVQRLIELERIAEHASSAAEAADDDERFFFVKSQYNLVKVEIDRICYVEGLKDYVKIYLDDQPKPVITLSTLKQMEAKLGERSFLRVHKSFIANIMRITGVEKSNLCIGEMRVPIGDGYRQRFNDALAKMTLK